MRLVSQKLLRLIIRRAQTSKTLFIAASHFHSRECFLSPSLCMRSLRILECVALNDQGKPAAEICFAKIANKTRPFVSPLSMYWWRISISTFGKTKKGSQGRFFDSWHCYKWKTGEEHLSYFRHFITFHRVVSISAGKFYAPSMISPIWITKIRGKVQWMRAREKNLHRFSPSLPMEMPYQRSNAWYAIRRSEKSTRPLGRFQL